jgi:tripartite-type tricarboxylate transporter receptor subunit TctC
MRTRIAAATNRLAPCAIAACLLAAPAAAPAQDYPTRPVHLIVPTAAGGGTDISARMIAPRLSQILGQQVVVEIAPAATPPSAIRTSPSRRPTATRC